MHLPWGAPQGGAGKGGCILTQQDFVTGYSTSLRLPLWVAYKLYGEVRAESFLAVADPGGGTRGAHPPPQFLDQAKIFFWRPPPPLI